MTRKRAKENENPEPQTGRGHKLTDRLRNRQLGHEELPNRENVTHRNDGHAPRADSPEGASGRPTARGGGAATSRQRGARDTRGPSPRLSGRLRLYAPTAPAAGKGVEGLERSRTAGGAWGGGRCLRKQHTSPRRGPAIPRLGVAPRVGPGRTQTCARTCRQLQCQPRTRRPPHTLPGGRAARADPRQRRAEL